MFHPVHRLLDLKSSAGSKDSIMKKRAQFLLDEQEQKKSSLLGGRGILIPIFNSIKTQISFI